MGHFRVTRPDFLAYDLGIIGVSRSGHFSLRYWSLDSSTPRQFLDKRTNLVAHAVIVMQRLFLRLRLARHARRIVEAGMHDPRPAGKHGAPLVRVVTDCHDVVERHVAHLVCSAQP
jgi:hypothetical protein